MGTGGVIPVPSPAARGGKVLTAKRAPEGLQGLEWVVRAWTDVLGRRRGRALYPPFGPGRSTPVALPGTGPLECRLLANKDEI